MVSCYQYVISVVTQNSELKTQNLFAFYHYISYFCPLGKHSKNA